MSNRRASLMQAAQTVPAEMKQKWINAFNQFDIMQTGVITEGELEEVMRTSLNMIPAEGEVAAMIEAVDHDNDSAVSYEEFELMMVAAGRGNNGGRLGFSHVVDRFIRMSDIAMLVAQECNGFVEQFCRQHADKFGGLASPDVGAQEQLPSWHDVYRQFTEEAELTIQNVLLLWGTATTKSFDEDFLDLVGSTGIVENFLNYSEYPQFIRKMYETVQSGQGGAPPVAATPRPETPCGNASTQQRLAKIDRQLAMLDYQRNQLLAERRRLVGAEVQPITTAALKRELEMRKWREDVGFD